MSAPTRRDWYWREGEYTVPAGSVWREAELDGPWGTIIVCADFIRDDDGKLLLRGAEAFCDGHSGEPEPIEVDSETEVPDLVSLVERLCAEKGPQP